MLTVETRHAVHQDHAKTMDTDTLRRHFRVADIFADGEIRLVYTHYDRMVVGGAVPGAGTLTLDKVDETRTTTFLERREMAVVNIGDTGTVEANDTSYELGRGDVLYLGMGTGAVTFSGGGRFYITSAPAHRALPSRRITLAESNAVKLGAVETSNKRTINQFVHPLVMESCQLVLGYTTLEDGSVWNTMPAHVHDRRMEAYLYFNMGADQRILHVMGEPDETRHMVLANEEGALSPPWSVHCGAGTGGYTFIWAMAGDNVDYTDMDFVSMGDMK
ncbi:MAG: 5-dehydro-4-deoxy-D-glucuronate isomerase [Stappia sp.]|uniref:5-dehydro-4-deoxy-D-glucuronate isomerase n=1 Tax=Stappia sp. TaxID=1870903 RepID=UPI000C3C5215|nr:5-dehydro-4-deoxy-D-glucuronate isomerase [Stappia sp.]MAB00720.1 5-dehydro-4-deoxy-D-glucuronate isomerase [Stappia sp.]MBM18790.1 5-dehydro-4-deoxy-D-glucuronate isomerase [Stappia sp.]